MFGGGWMDTAFFRPMFWKRVCTGTLGGTEGKSSVSKRGFHRYLGEEWKDTASFRPVF